MKTFMLFIVLLMAAITVQAQDFDQGFESYTYQANSLCPFHIKLTAGQTSSPITYHLSYYDTVQDVGTLATGDSVDMHLPITDQWYILIVEREAGDKDAYTVDTDMGCDLNAGGGADPQQAEHEAQLRAIFEEIAPKFQAGLMKIFGK